MRTTSSFLVRTVGLGLVGMLSITACAADEQPVGDADGPEATEPTGPDPADDAAGGVESSGGWIDGEPNWTGDGGSAVELDMAAAEAPESEAARSGADSATAEVVSADAGSFGDDASVAPPGGDVVDPAPSEPLRAGSVDDGADFAGFLDYVDRVTNAGFSAREIDLTGRVVVEVVDDEGRPVPGVELRISSPTSIDAGLASIRTTADGTARFFPGLHGFDTDAPVEIGVAFADTDLTTVSPGDTVTITAPTADVAAPVPLDIMFLLDATGSMGDEIDRLKQTIDTVADRVNRLDPRPDVRFAMTLYRDEGDAFVTSTFDFTDDVAVFRDALAAVVADGGGDTPEALDEGLAEALAAPAWRDPSEAVQLVFLVADAPPQVDRQVPTPYTASIREAVGRGIKIFPIASSESDDVAELVFRQLAVATGAPFVFLSYGAGGAATGGETDIDRTDYEELALDELVVRLVAEELADLPGGQTPVPPPTTAPPTTVPDGQ